MVYNTKSLSLTSRIRFELVFLLHYLLLLYAFFHNLFILCVVFLFFFRFCLVWKFSLFTVLYISTECVDTFFCRCGVVQLGIWWRTSESEWVAPSLPLEHWWKTKWFSVWALAAPCCRRCCPFCVEITARETHGKHTHTHIHTTLRARYQPKQNHARTDRTQARRQIHVRGTENNKNKRSSNEKPKTTEER